MCSVCPAAIVNASSIMTLVSTQASDALAANHCTDSNNNNNSSNNSSSNSSKSNSNNSSNNNNSSQINNNIISSYNSSKINNNNNSSNNSNAEMKFKRVQVWDGGTGQDKEDKNEEDDDERTDSTSSEADKGLELGPPQSGRRRRAFYQRLTSTLASEVSPRRKTQPNVDQESQLKTTLTRVRFWRHVGLRATV